MLTNILYFINFFFQYKYIENKKKNIMNKIQKKRLYESIMRSVSKTVKKKLNEADDSFENNEIYTHLHDMFETAEEYNQVF